MPLRSSGLLLTLLGSQFLLFGEGGHLPQDIGVCHPRIAQGAREWREKKSGIPPSPAPEGQKTPCLLQNQNQRASGGFSEHPGGHFGSRAVLGPGPEPLRQGQWEDGTPWLLWCTLSSGVLSQLACYCLLSGGLQQLLRAFCPAARATSVGETGLCSFPRPGTDPVGQTWCRPVTCTPEGGALASWPSQIAVSL